MSVPKKESFDRRTVIDLSFPPGSSVHDGIPKQENNMKTNRVLYRQALFHS